MNTRYILTAISVTMLSSVSQADDVGFLTDYSVLTDTQGGYGTKALYITPGAEERMSNYSKVMIDQPEIFIDSDSKYKGMKPDTMTEIAESLRTALSVGASEYYEVVDQPGDDVLYIRWAITKMYLQKPKRRLVSFTPVGFVAHGVKSGVSDFVEKNTLVEMTLEGEVMDSQTGDLIVSMIIQRGQRKDKAKGLSEDLANWDDLMAIGTGLGKRFGCRLNNARVDESERIDCLAIPLTAGG